MTVEGLVAALVVALAVLGLVRHTRASVRRFGPGRGLLWVGLSLLGASRLNPRNRRRLRRGLGFEDRKPPRSGPMGGRQ